ncbi:MAG TPA: FemAB family XrtA/PEP-CTERM system-associated protein [Burkholderiales bacterium]|nr:FemAB family XrtA/PEP-CTERM system-associated protein [Burkholderiales bacterium]
MTITIESADSRDEQEWTAYVARHAGAHLAHCWAWKDILENAFGHGSHFLIARKNIESEPQAVVGVLPLFHVKSFLFGSALIAVPYLNGGGVLADDGEVRQALVEAASSLGLKLGVKYVELRQRDRLLGGVTNLFERSHKVILLLPLINDSQQMFMSFPSKLRNKIRRPEKSGFHVEEVSGASEDLSRIETFYEVFSHHMRDLGTPVYPKSLFVSVARAFRERCRVLLVWYEGKPTSCGMTIGYNNQVEIPWASSLMKYNQFRPNTLLFWHAIKRACEDGYAAFDFGRSSPDAGTYEFKRQWGSEPAPLYWYYAGGEANVPDVNPKNPKFSALVECWKRLPVPLANAVGPWITRSLP